jgi:hypothetical protein
MTKKKPLKIEKTENVLTRKEAIDKLAEIAILSTTMLVLVPKKSVAESSPPVLPSDHSE